MALAQENPARQRQREAEDSDISVEILREILSKNPAAMVVEGRGGAVIGVVVRGAPGVDEKMVVLFSNPPTHSMIGRVVHLVEYAVRDSQKTDKKYVKCFKYIDREALVRAVSYRAARELAEIIGEVDLDRLSKALENLAFHGTEAAAKEIVSCCADASAFDNNKLYIYRSGNLAMVEREDLSVTRVDDTTITASGYIAAEHMTSYEFPAIEGIIEEMPGLKIYKIYMIWNLAIVIVPRGSREEKIVRYIRSVVDSLVDPYKEEASYAAVEEVKEILRRILKEAQKQPS